MQPAVWLTHSVRAGLPHEPAAVRQHTRGPSKPVRPAKSACCRPAVYALGLYVDPAAVQQRVAPKFQGQAPDALARSQQLPARRRAGGQWNYSRSPTPSSGCIWVPALPYLTLYAPRRRAWWSQPFTDAFFGLYMGADSTLP